MKIKIETHLEGNVLAKSLQPLFHIFRTCLCTIASWPHTQHFQQDQAQKKSTRQDGVALRIVKFLRRCSDAYETVIVCWIVHACSRPLQRYLDLLLEWFIIWDYGGELQIFFFWWCSPLLNWGKNDFQFDECMGWNHQLDWHLKHFQVNPHIDGPIWRLLFNWAMN